MRCLPLFSLLVMIFSLPAAMAADEEVRVLFVAVLFDESPQGAEFAAGLEAEVAQEFQRATGKKARP